MRIKNYILTTCIFLLASLFLVGCGTNTGSNDGDNTDGSKNSGGETTLAEEQVLNISLITEPPSLHPGKPNDIASVIVLTQVFEGMTRLNADDVPEEAMASKIDKSDDGLKYTFTIRDDANWSNGDPVTAEDFEYAWKWVLDPENADASAANQLFVIKNGEKAKSGEVSIDEVGIKVIDDKTLEVELEYSAEYFLKQLTNQVYFPVNKKVAEEHPDWDLNAGENYVTNGPFTLAEWDQKNKIVFKKNPDYWDAETVKLETINMPIISDENTEINMYQNGELDFAGHPTGKLPLASIASLKEEGVLHTDPQTAVYHYFFNVEEAPFDNVNIRKAFALSIDREAIVENITQAGETPATAFVPPSIWEENAAGYFPFFDVDQAKEHLEKGLEEEGYSSVDDLPAISLTYNTSEEHAHIAQAIQDMWKENLGVEVTLANNEWQVFLDMLEAGDYQVARYGSTAAVDDASFFLNNYAVDTNYSNWENKTFNDLLADSNVEQDPEKRKEILQAAEEILVDELAILPIYYYTNVYVMKDYVHDLDISGLRKIQFKWAYITEE